MPLLFLFLSSPLNSFPCLLPLLFFLFLSFTDVQFCQPETPAFLVEVTRSRTAGGGGRLGGCGALLVRFSGSCKEILFIALEISITDDSGGMKSLDKWDFSYTEEN